MAELATGTVTTMGSVELKIGPSTVKGKQFMFIFWDVFLNHRKIDTVTAVDTGCSLKEQAEETRRSLVNHDGYDPGIVVRKRRDKK